MIEINLLPQIWREPDGPNLPRLAAVGVCVLIASIGGFYVGKLYLVDIPKTNASIKSENDRQKDLQARVTIVQAKDKELADLKARVNGLENLDRSRILWSRFLYYFKPAVPEKYCVIKSFNVGPDDNEVPMEGVGRRYKLEVTGLTNANTDKECQQILTNFQNNLKERFVVKPAPGPVPVNTADPAAAEQAKSDLPAGFHPEIRMKFVDPLVRSAKNTKLSQLAGLSPKDKPDQYPLMDRALDFTLTMSFALPPAKAANE